MDPLESVRAARDAQNQAEAMMAAAVQQARESGRTWQEIGAAAGVPQQAVFQRYGNPTPLPEAADLARTVIGDLVHARWADVSARFDATMREGLTEDELAGAWAQILDAAGAYQSHGDTAAVRTGDFTTTNTPLSFEAGGFVARITFWDDHTIAGLYILNPDVAARTESR
ncbi:hypothetical protein FHT44_003015 [Mycolicibacterium sp. BK634]|uniref:DUF3887 domain-containing protein n=1 Tax=Mycolicibacterium sp. BK634 TaxID=2587099 RepID=UPI00161F8EE8|nr:DUF3887 domain-containing protein [Mycolicibacterium sp. BK634]MBB3750520.1 hypothetical protein [Mycolicibacterium sp. BK634]